MKVLVIVGSVRQERAADKVWPEAVEALKANEFDVDLADLKDVALPFYDEPIPPIAALGKYDNEVGAEWAARVKAADAVVLLTPEYNYGTSAVLKNAIDWAYEGWTDKPIAIVSWGVDGGSHVQGQLKETMGVLKARVVADVQMTLDFINTPESVVNILKTSLSRLGKE